MKKLLFLAIAIFCITLLLASEKPISNSDNDESENILCRSLPDSIYSLVKNRPVIFYSYGHHGYTWAMIANIDGNLRAFSGRIGYDSRYLNESTEDDRFDSTLLFSKNRALFSWGFDTIPTKSGVMRKVDREHYITFYTDLSIFNSEGNNVFNSNDAVAFSGPDSINFNQKFNRLSLIMYWLSFHKIREYIPEAEIF